MSFFCSSFHSALLRAFLGHVSSLVRLLFFMAGMVTLRFRSVTAFYLYRRVGAILGMVVLRGAHVLAVFLPRPKLPAPSLPLHPAALFRKWLFLFRRPYFSLSMYCWLKILLPLSRFLAGVSALFRISSPPAQSGWTGPCRSTMLPPRFSITFDPLCSPALGGFDN